MSAVCPVCPPVIDLISPNAAVLSDARRIGIEVTSVKLAIGVATPSRCVRWPSLLDSFRTGKSVSAACLPVLEGDSSEIDSFCGAIQTQIIILHQS